MLNAGSRLSKFDCIRDKSYTGMHVDKVNLTYTAQWNLSQCQLPNTQSQTNILLKIRELQQADPILRIIWPGLRFQSGSFKYVPTEICCRKSPIPKNYSEHNQGSMKKNTYHSDGLTRMSVWFFLYAGTLVNYVWR